MNVTEIENNLKKQMCSDIHVQQEGLNRYIIDHPFTFDDGDHFTVILKKIGNKWEFSDEGHTIMHLSYEDVELNKGGYKEIINSTVSAFELTNREGELILPVQETMFGDTFFSYIQALVKISDIKYLERERVKSLFMEEFKGFLRVNVPEPRRKFDYYHPVKDPGRVYPVDCRIEARTTPLFIFGITNDSKCQTATTIIYWWEKLGEPFDVIAVHENQEEINRKVLARFSNVCGRQFSSLPSNKERIVGYIQERLNGS
jgi:hypothetical protein